MCASQPRIRVSGIVKQSIVDGPGLRLVVFSQGCPHGCPGCHNPETHPFEGGELCEIDTILKELDANPLLKGITLSGGEPFAQPEAMAVLAEAAKGRGKDVICYSGYTLEQLLDMAERQEAIGALLRQIDILVDGPYIQEQRDLTLRFRGSKNQRAIHIPSSLSENRAVLLDW